MPGSSSSWPVARYAWAVVAILFLTYIVSFIDRTVLTLLVDPIKADLALSDLQIGLLTGLAFGLFYSVMGLPLGWLADRASRTIVIGVGVAVWSIATALCGLANSFAALFADRMLVGIGEAALAPAALSLISDLFEPAKRSLPVSVFVMAGSVGGGAAMIMGGWMIATLTSLGEIQIGSFGVFEPWRLTFFLVGLPGVILALVFFLISEPKRRVESNNTASSDGNLETGHFITFLSDRWRILVPLFGAMTFVAIVAYWFLSWIPTFFIREFEWTAGQVGFRFGCVFLFFGALGSVTGGVVSRIVRKRGVVNANLVVVAIGIAGLIVPAVAAPIMHSAQLALLLLAPVMFFFAFPSGVAAAAVQEIAPNKLRGQTTALYYIVMNLFGLSLGAPIIAVISDAISPKGDALGVSMSIIAVFALPVATALAVAATRFHKLESSQFGETQ